MRIIRVSSESYERMVRAQGKFCEFVKVPSTITKFAYQGLLMPNGVWVAWPQDLTEGEYALYVERYGDIPDIIEVNMNKKIWTKNTPTPEPKDEA